MNNIVPLNKKLIEYERLKSPITAQIEITPRCNNQCLYCYNYWRSNEKIENELKIHEVEAVSDKIVNSDLFRVVLTGGEPLLRKDLVYFWAQKLSLSSINVKINSNLSLLERDDLKRMKDVNISGIFASLPSCDKDNYNYITQSDNYNKVVSNIKLAIKECMPISVNMVVTQINKDQVFETGKFIKDLGVTSFAATPVIPCSYLNPRLELSGQDLEKVLEDLNCLESKFNISTDIAEALPLCSLKKIDRYKRFFSRDCGAGKFIIAISSSGKVRPCTHIQEEYGNLLTEDFSKVWGRMAEWSTNKYYPLKCTDCRNNTKCSMGCREAAKTKNGSFSSLDPRAKYETPLGEMEEKRTFEKLDKSMRLTIIKDVKFRCEEKGMLLYSPKKGSLIYVNRDFFKYILFLNSKDWFSINSLSGYDENVEAIENAISLLLRKGFISIVKN